MSEKHLYYDKELSWLSFNERVLQEAADNSVPIIERIRFLGIFSSNLDEFFQVRIAKIRRKLLLAKARAEEEPEKLWNLEKKLTLINTKIAALNDKLMPITQDTITELNNNKIQLLFHDEKSKPLKKFLSRTQLDWLKTHFNHQIIRHITPIIISTNTQFAECIDDDGIYLFASLIKDEQPQFALVEIPREEVDRFIILPQLRQTDPQRIVMLDDVVHQFLDDIFQGIFEYDELEAYSIKLTRDAEYNLDDELDHSLLDKMSKGLKQRLKAEPVRIGFDRRMPEYMVKFLKKALRIKDSFNLVPGGRYRHFKDFIGFPNLGTPELEKSDLPALTAHRFTRENLSFDAITKNDVLVYYPYYRFRHFTEFVRQASYDPHVKEIKINIYRVAKHSEIIHSLIEAVKNGKQVTVVVELRARFDEQANIEWAKRMKDAGINVEFGIESLKIHSKLCLVIRKEADKLVRYAHIGTGNFHEKNARVYTDFSLFTKHKEIAQEVDNVFSFIEHSYKRFRFNHLIVSPITSRRRLYQLIDNEMEYAVVGEKAEITLKVNNLVDRGLIDKLYDANNAGVRIKLIVRGMCSLVPGIEGQSENISAISIVDQFLEHPRVMLFRNGGDESLYIGSADWMERNIDQRVEVACPIYDEVLKKRIIQTLELQLRDDKKARLINNVQDNQYVQFEKPHNIRSQIAIYEYLAAEEDNDSQALEELHK